MSQHTELFEFLSELIDIQIKKYVELAKRKVVEDALINADLVSEEVNELLVLAEQVLKEIENNEKSDSSDSIDRILDQVKFYLEQEHLRSYAEWLLIKNDSQDTVYYRTGAQLRRLGEIKRFASEEYSQPITHIQQQCQHDSVQIIHSILALAIQLRENPDMELDKSIPADAQVVLRRNATTRYIEFKDTMGRWHQSSEDFLQESTLKFSDTELLFEPARKRAMQHESQLEYLRSRYQSIKSPSQSEEVEGDEMVSEEKDYSAEVPERKSVFSSTNLLFFGGVALAAVIFLPRLLSQFKVNRL
ncbi:hypothetical protein EP47_04775 [Legionella norrlandica]|uniref:Uncharacterized protein n=1 Tax=Legionella norrlandica TaxID=1498499 RepID=A0A0A2T8C8_9GAMM|nr:hypothetical protein [Legionella norrlandica]KGP63683.1 hypothetical protein EP47_04775 [Legionella norrlandica]